MPISSNISLMLLFLYNIPLCVQRAKILSRRTWEAFESPDFKLHTQEVLMWKDSLGPQGAWVVGNILSEGGEVFLPLWEAHQRPDRMVPDKAVEFGI